METFQDLVKKYSADLSLYEPPEATNLVYWLLEKHLGFRKVDLFGKFDSESLPPAFLKDFGRLKVGEPIQYILGSAPFYGREFKVNPATLIPRNETEELVHWIIKEHDQPKLKILDIGTGTGCIPISLALEFNQPEIMALDISPDALKIATENARELGAKVDFFELNILERKPEIAGFDILVSNPPYVLNSDKSAMKKNVLDHEPGLALFVSDDNPLIFYERIAKVAKEILKPGGCLYFEIHERFGNEIKEMLDVLGYSQIQVRQDLNGKNRMIRAFLPV